MSVASALSSVVDAVQVTRVERSGARVLKRRRALSPPVVFLGNFYMRWCGARIAMFVRVARWSEYERRCSAMLHPQRSVASDGVDALSMEALPGETLRALAMEGALPMEALRAAGREMARCHRCDDGRFAHGDPHMGNVLYDAEGDRAYLIDFETEYLSAVPVAIRRANDLLVLVQELLALAPEDQWPAWPLALLDGYNDPAITRALAAELRFPTGLGRVLWASRTRRRPRDFVERRLASLRESLR